MVETNPKPEGLNIVGEGAQYVYKQYGPEKRAQREAIRQNFQLPEYKMKEDIVISGMSGRFPDSDSIDEFSQNMYNGVDLVTEDERRWPFGYLGLPRRSGKIRDISLFDNEFFKIDDETANYVDSQVRILLEITFEALWDSGIDPKSWAGSRTGVYLGHCFDEYMSAYTDFGINIPSYRQNYFSMLHNIFDFKGPATHFDTACASGFSAFHQAIVSLRAGECDQAIVAGLNICLRAGTQHQFLNLNMLSPEGKCKCLDDDANGYAKGEACAVVILQRRSQARRIYATIIHSKTNCDGFKDFGITFPSFELQREVISDAFKEAKLDPNEIEYCEAHCTGTQAGDPSEMRAIVESMCIGRTKPLKIGALKSVIGHTEGASGLCGLVKSILCFENELIPPNLHMSKMNHRIEGLTSGILQPVTECTPFKGRKIAMNCFGFGGVNVHAIIEKNSKEISENDYEFGPLPRLITFCGRNQETLDNIHQFLINNPDKLTTGFLSLLDSISKTTAYKDEMFFGMQFRGARLFKPDVETNRLKPVDEVRFNQITSENKPSVCFVFTGMGCQWPMMGRELARIPCISKIFDQCSSILKCLDSSFDLMNILTGDDRKLLQSSTNSFVAIAVIQMALIEFLRELEIEPDYVIGHSIGELTCAYADQCLNLEQTLTAAYIRGKSMATLAAAKPGKMAAIGCTWEQAQQYCQQYSKPDGNVWPACHNSYDSVTVAGSESDMDYFIAKLQQNEPDLFVRAINSSRIAFHCKLIEEIREPLRKQLADSIKLSKEVKISSKWLSTTYDKNNVEDFAIDYLVDNLLEPVRFYDVFKRLPSNTLFVEIAPNNLLQAVIKRNIFDYGMESKYAPTMIRKSGANNVDVLLSNIGQLYVNGLSPKIEILYPSYNYPVARTTQSLHSMIRWKHDRHFKCTKYPEFFNHDQTFKTFKSVDMQIADDKFYGDHCVDGRVLFPATGYLFFAWELASRSFDRKREETPIIFEDVVIHRATILPKSGIMTFAMKYNKQNGMFTMLNDGTVTATGRITILNKGDKFLLYQDMMDSIESELEKPFEMQLPTKDLYKEFRLRGYDYGPEFQSINQITVTDQFSIASISFKNWVTFVDGMIQTVIIGRPIRALLVPVRIDYLACDPFMLSQKLSTSVRNDGGKISLDSIYDFCLNIAATTGIEFRGIKPNLAPRRIHPIPPVESSYEFVAFNQKDEMICTNRANSDEHRRFLTEQLFKYQEYCAKYLQQNNCADDQSFDIQQYENKVHQPILLKILKEIDFDNFEPAQLDMIEDDYLFHSHMNEVFIRPQLETVVENIWDSSIDILEVSQTRNIMATDILKWIEMDTFRVNFNYRLLHPSPSQVNADHMNAVCSQYEWLAGKSKFPNDLLNIDLVIYKDSSICPLLSKYEIDFHSMLESSWECLKDNGFAIILLRDHYFAFEQHLMKKLGINHHDGGNHSCVDRFMDALQRTSFKLIGHRNDRLGVHCFFIRKISQEIIPENQIYINFTNNVRDWFDLLQNSLKDLRLNQSIEQKYVWLIANDSRSGVIGFTNCLRKEPNGLKIRCILNASNAGPIDVTSDTVKNIVKLNLQMSAIGPDGSFGSFRHFSLSTNQFYDKKPVEHCFVNVQTRGDLSSVHWFEAQHKHWPMNRKFNENFFTVYYSTLNFRDVMIATGKLPPDALPMEIGLDDCLMGLEFAGRDENGNRVMGMKQSKCLATTLIYDQKSCLTWPIPDNWTMEEAVTVPVAYGTAYYALIIRGNLKQKEKVLIHSGSGAVGQAAIAICLHYNCHLFITVGSDEKRAFLMEKFPQLKSNQFASSRDTAFEKMILKETNGTGVDIVLNSLAEDKLFASINCLAPYGRFLEIGKFDLSQNSKLDVSQIMKNKTFHGILLDNMIHVYPCTPNNILLQRRRIWEMITEGLQNGVIVPLNRTVFNIDECEEAFRYMTTGKHMGKILIKIREEEIAGSANFDELMKKNNSLRIPAIPRTVFHSNKSYIVTGGLGGFGMELINWMIEREARNFIITSRNGIKNQYQKWRIEHFEKLGVRIEIFTQDTTTEEGVENLINDALKLAPLGGVFHLAMVIKDGLFENQTLESFEDVIKPKSNTFILLDDLTRKKSLNLDYFVGFSSVSCGIGNPGQSNYGFGNSVIERVCDQRRNDGLNGMAIQWGPIGDVGYIIDNVRGNDIVVCGAIPQRIPSCLMVMDRLLQNPYSVCSSLIWTDSKLGLCGGKTSLIKTVAHILGIKDYEKLEPNVTLGELGMDSLMTVEIKQVMERDFDAVYSLQDLRKLTISQIIEISEGKAKVTAATDNADKQTAKQQQSMDDKLVPKEPIVYLNDIINGDPILFFPPLDSTFDSMLPIALRLNRPVIGINWTPELKDMSSLKDTATHFIRLLEERLNLEKYDVIAYSFGGVIALEMGIQLQQRVSSRIPRYNRLILLDSSPKQFKIFTDVLVEKYSINQNEANDAAYIDSMLMYLRGKITMDTTKIRDLLINMNDNQQRIKFLTNLMKQTQNIDIKTDTLDYLMRSHYRKLVMVNQYRCADKQFDGDLTLIRASNVLIKSDDIPNDYGIGDLITGKCHLHILNGDHENFMTNNHETLIDIIKKYI